MLPLVKTSANGLLDKADKPKALRQNLRTCKFCETFKNPRTVWLLSNVDFLQITILGILCFSFIYYVF